MTVWSWPQARLFEEQGMGYAAYCVLPRPPKSCVPPLYKDLRELLTRKRVVPAGPALPLHQ
jgi:hypothetical protein